MGTTVPLNDRLQETHEVLRAVSYLDSIYTCGEASRGHRPKPLALRHFSWAPTQALQQAWQTR